MPRLFHNSKLETYASNKIVTSLALAKASLEESILSHISVFTRNFATLNASGSLEKL